jgi:hypothetical protein
MIHIVSEHAEETILQIHDRLAARGNLSDATIGSYIAVVRDFASWYESWTGKCFRIRHLPTSAFNFYQKTLQERGMKPGTVKRHMGILRRLLDLVTVSALLA